MVVIALEEDTDLLQKTFMVIKPLIVVIGYCSVCKRKNLSLLVIIQYKQKDLIVLKNLGKKGFIVSTKMAKNVLANPSRALDMTANNATAAASGNPKNVMKTLLELITFCNTGTGLYLGKFVYIMQYK